jgi:hypothetical protein
MTQYQDKQQLDELVRHKVTRRVAGKVMRDLHDQVDEIQHEQENEERLGRFLIPMLTLVVLVILGLLLWPYLLRWVTAAFS